MTQRYLNETEVAKITGLSIHFFRKKRTKGGGPKFCKFGRSVRYPEDELNAWLRELGLKRSTSDIG